VFSTSYLAFCQSVSFNRRFTPTSLRKVIIFTRKKNGPSLGKLEKNHAVSETEENFVEKSISIFYFIFNFYYGQEMKNYIIKICITRPAQL